MAPMAAIHHYGVPLVHILHRIFLGQPRWTESLRPSLPGPEPSAATVLCLHGLTRNSRDFEDLAPHLQRRYRVIVPDVRGRGLSARDPNPQNYQPAIYIQDMIGLLDAVGAAASDGHRHLDGRLAGMMMGGGSSRPRLRDWC